MTNAVTTVNVELGKRSYAIHIGAGTIGLLPDAINRASKGARCAVITDRSVNACQGAKLVDVLESADIRHHTIEIDPGETSKSWQVLEHVTERVLEAKLERNDFIVAFGGGVVGDLAGFVASIARRGINLLQVPTSLLAQVDSSVGGKTAINSTQGKNLVGAFYQPAEVIVDLDVLSTLPEREFRAGYAEVVKYGLIADIHFFSWLEKHQRTLDSNNEHLAYAIAKSCQAKADIVTADETEKGNRALLNLGHTFGHALEGFVGYDTGRLVHGEGVAIGMTLAHEFSNRLNQCSSDDVERVRHHLTASGLPTSISDIPGEKPSSDVLMQFIAQDKKVMRGALTFVLTKGIGKAYIAEDVPPAEVENFLKDQLSS